VGDYVEVDEVIAEIETDKTALQVPAPVGGVLEELLVADGDTVTPGMDLARIRVSGPGTGATPTPSSTTEPATQETTPPPPAVEATPTPSPIPSSPPLPPPLPVEPMSTSPPPLPLTAPSLGGVSRAEKRVKMNRMRQRIAERLKDAQNTNAMLTTFNEVDMSNIIEMRRKWKEDFLEKHGVKLGFMSPFVKAACHALLHQPVVNAVIDGNQIIYRDYVDISIAVATPKGLVVPVLRNVETMNCADIEKTTAQLGQKARDGTLAIEDMDGGTFTISNGGVFGSLFGTPIINPPQSAILGMHATVDRPVAIQGKVEVRPMMYVALTYDHRLIDGREAVLFLKKIKQAVEDPRVFLLGL
jgi:2-oxoglutarate dehydrogenase E2 component (dihydrolipoamide succinyltransferase)